MLIRDIATLKLSLEITAENLPEGENDFADPDAGLIGRARKLVKAEPEKEIAIEDIPF